MMGQYGWGYDMMGGGWLGGILMLLFGAVILAGVVLLIVWAVRQSTGNSTGQSTSAGPQGPPQAADHDEAVAIAKRRLASGEITAEQYQELMRVLG